MFKDTVGLIRGIADAVASLDAKTTGQPASIGSLVFTYDNTGGTSDYTTQLSASSLPVHRVLLKRDAADTGIVKIGGADSQNYPLDAGEAVELEISDLSKIYITVSAGAKATIYALYVK